MRVQEAGELTTRTLLDRAEMLLAARAVPQALAAFHAAERAGADPDRCAGGRWWCHMLLGHYPSAWAESDAIRARGLPDPNRVWDGRPIEPGARLLVRSVHGYGDALQMGRFLPRLRAARVTLQCAPALCELLRLLPGVHEVVPWGEERPCDAQLEVTELAYCVRATVEDIGREVPYLAVPAPPRPTGPPRIGLVWTGGEWNPARWLPFSALEPLLRAAEASGAEAWSLQMAAQNDEWRARAAAHGQLCRAGGEQDVMGLARAVAGMDLVITADTFVAHLAGAMGKPCWVMLEREADWRWLLGREDSPWYPAGMRLFRQGERGEWGPLVERIAWELRAWAAAR